MRALIITLILMFFTVGGFAQKQSAEWFSVETIQGKSFDLSDLRGKVVVLYFWSTTCPICESIAPKLNLVADEFSNDNVVFLAVTGDRKTKVEPFLKNHKMSFDVVTGNFDIIMKYGDKGKDGDFSMPFPSLFVIDQTGRIDLKSVGAKAPGDVESSLKRLTSK